MSTPAATPEQRFRIALDLHQSGIEIMRQNLRRAHPHESDAEIAQRLGSWIRTRPGAEHGDCTGPLFGWPDDER